MDSNELKLNIFKNLINSLTSCCEVACEQYNRQGFARSRSSGSGWRAVRHITVQHRIILEEDHTDQIRSDQIETDLILIEGPQS